ncbi:type I restriction enzyme subunit R domain-containing protein, partial [Mycoplasmopsis cricetuli]|uniref:type I restriction enzyme subunit R domain-containing protein n=1 Tax=Mycoplasmopsis cricetuli TaxID=171283 RepID=UPI00047021D3
ILQRYNEKFLTSFTLETFNDYINDVRVRFKKSNKQNKNQIDIVLVVNMLLTGYDSPKTNTLYINKSLKNHNLIQAFSRTNRIFDFQKKHGYIVNFSLEKNTIDEAFQKYADAKEDQIIEIVYGKTWEQSLEDTKKFLSDLHIQFEKIYDIKNDKLKENSSIKERRDYLKLFSNLAREFSNLKTYPEYNNTEKIKGFTLDEYKRFEGYCDDIYDSLPANEQNSSEYRVISSSNMNSVDEIIKIDIDYLNNLLFQKNDLKDIFLNDEFKIEDIKKFEEEKKKILNNFSYINKNKEINLHLNEFYEGYCSHIHEIFNQKEKWTKKDFNAILEFQKKEITEKLLVQMQENIVKKIKQNFPLIKEDDMEKDFLSRIKEEDWTDISDSEWIQNLIRHSTITSNDALKLKEDYKNKLFFYIKFKNKIKSENQGEN